MVLGNSTNGEVYQMIILEIIKKADQAGLHVVNVTTDMGSPNQAMWRSFGVGITRMATPSFSIAHPCRSDSKLYFLADVPHVVKNLRTALCKYDFKIDDKVVSMKPVEYLAKHDQNRELKLAPKLKVGDIHSSHFDKMKVGCALHVFSRSVASGIRFLVENGDISGAFVKQCMDTAWFIDLINHWFDLMSSRHLGLALSKANIQKYDQEIQFLQNVVDIFYALRIGKEGGWKPVQTGVILCTLSVISLSDELLAGGLEFLMTSRLTQDCLENLFSTIRSKSSTPSVVQFRDSLKIVTVAQFLKTPRNSSYQIDESTYLGNYLEKLETPSEPTEEVVVTSNELVNGLDSSDSNSLYYITGWSLKAVKTTCDACCSSAISEKPLDLLAEHSKLTVLKEYKVNALRHPTVLVFQMLQSAELVFRQWKSAITEVENVKSFILSKISPYVVNFNFPSCHSVKDRILNKYVTLRLHIACSKVGESGKDESCGYLGSKSMAMRKVVKRMK